jgi:competence protein ComEC
MTGAPDPTRAAPVPARAAGRLLLPSSGRGAGRLPGRRPSRRWTEENVEPPIDLRLVPMALGLWAGSVGGLLAGAPLLTHLLWWVAAAVGLVGLLVVFRGTRLRSRGNKAPSTGRWRLGLAVAAVATAAGAVIAGLATVRAAGDPLTAAAASGRFAVLTVRVDAPAVPLRSTFGLSDSDPSAKGVQRVRIGGRAEQATVAGHQWETDLPVSVLATGEQWRSITPGQLLRVEGVLRPDTFPVIPAVQLRTVEKPTVLAAAPWWARAAAGIRIGLSERAGELGGDPAGLLPGLVVGDTSGISDRLEADAKATGLTHLLAVSGSHFAIVCGLAVLILRRVGPRVAAVGGGVVLLGLVVLVGPQPSVLRAAAMGGIGVFALLVGRARTALPALAAVVIALLVVDPALALSAGFALSVQATAGLVLLAPVWSKSLQRKGFPRGWADLIAVPLAASVATQPVVTALSGAVSLAAVPANILVAAVVPPALVIGLLCALIGPLSGPVGDALALADEPLLGWIGWVAHTLARTPDASVPWPAALPWVLVLTGTLIVVLGVLRHQRIRALVGAALAGVALVMVPLQVLPSPGWPPAGWMLAGCEVGQGDAFALSTDDAGTAVVVDSGPDPGLVANCLDRLGIATVPLLILTHLHADHVDGMRGVLDGRSIGMIGVGPGRDPAIAWATVLDRARLRGIPVVELHPGNRWAVAGLSIEVLGPEREFRGTDSDPNNDSVVLRAERSGVRILMSGDVEVEAQQALLRSGADLRADVLKVPHHGSAKDLPEFLAAVSPTVAVIGVGLGNDYGHPSPELLDRLTAAGVSDIERTDTQGDVAVCLVDGRLADVHRGATLRQP